MRPSAAALLLVVAFSLACGRSVPGEDELPGIWGVEDDDGWRVREIAQDPMYGWFTVRELAGAPGESPVVYRTGIVYLEEEFVLPGGDVAPYALETFYADPREDDARLSGTSAFDIVEELRGGHHLTLRGLYDDDEVTYEYLDALP